MLDQLTVQNKGVPIYVQLRDQILALIGRGVLKPGGADSHHAPGRGGAADRSQHRAARLCRAGARRGADQDAGASAPSSPTRRRRPSNVRKALQDFAFRVAGEARGQGIALDDLAEALAKLADRGA